MDWEALIDIARRDIDVNPSYADVAGRYEGTSIPLPGRITVSSSTESITARLVESGDWWNRITSSLPPGPVEPGSLFRDVTPGVLSGRPMTGTMRADEGAWATAEALYVGEGYASTRAGHDTTYRFQIERLVIGDPALDAPIASSRLVFSGGEWGARSTLAGRKLVVAPFTRDEPKRDRQMLSATIEGAPDPVERQTLWLLVSFITGNRVSNLLTERYDGAGGSSARNISAAWASASDAGPRSTATRAG